MDNRRYGANGQVYIEKSNVEVTPVISSDSIEQEIDNLIVKEFPDKPIKTVSWEGIHVDSNSK